MALWKGSTWNLFSMLYDIFIFARPFNFYLIIFTPILYHSQDESQNQPASSLPTHSFLLPISCSASYQFSPTRLTFSLALAPVQSRPTPDDHKVPQGWAGPQCCSVCFVLSLLPQSLKVNARVFREGFCWVIIWLI